MPEIFMARYELGPTIRRHRIVRSGNTNTHQMLILQILNEEYRHLARLYADEVIRYGLTVHSKVVSGTSECGYLFNLIEPQDRDLSAREFAEKYRAERIHRIREAELKALNKPVEKKSIAAHLLRYAPHIFMGKLILAACFMLWRMFC